MSRCDPGETAQMGGLDNKYLFLERKDFMKEMQNLIGKEMNFIELDNAMEAAGSYTEFDDGLDFDEIVETGIMLYASKENPEIYYYIEFEKVNNDEQADKNIVRITNIYSL